MNVLQLRELAKKQKACKEAGNGIPPHMETSKSGFLYCSLVTYANALDMEDHWENGGCECMDPDTRVNAKDTMKPESPDRFHPACFYVTEKPLPNSNGKENSD